MAKVYLVQIPAPRVDTGWTPNFSAANDFGTIHPVFQPTHKPSLMGEEAVRIINQQMVDFDPETDFILWAGGDPAALIMVTSWVSYRLAPNQSIRLMRYEKYLDENGNRTGGGYYVPCCLPAGVMQNS